MRHIHTHACPDINAVYKSYLRIIFCLLSLSVTIANATWMHVRIVNECFVCLFACVVLLFEHKHGSLFIILNNTIQPVEHKHGHVFFPVSCNKIASIQRDVLTVCQIQNVNSKLCT